MGMTQKSMARFLRFHLILSGLAAALALLCAANLRAQEAQSAAVRSLGTVKAISGQTLTLTTDSGADLTVVVQDGAKLSRIEPGEKDLKNAATIQLQDLQIGDRVLVRGKNSADGKSLLAASVIVMKKTDIAQKQDQDQEEWQKHGAGGLVKAVDTTAGTIVLATSSVPNRAVTIRVSSSTVLRRYAPGSVRFDEAKPAPVTEIHVGDQLRARGSKSADGAELDAVEVVSGSFRNIAGTIAAIDTAAGTIVVLDLATKKPVTIKITSESQLRKLPAPMAMRIAARLKGLPAAPPPTAASGAAGGAQKPPEQGAAQAGGAAAPAGAVGVADLQTAISRIPPAHLSDLQKGDAVMIVGTAGDPATGISAITLLAGVEAILTAPDGGQSILTPWSMSGGGGGSGQEGQQGQQQQ